MVLVRKIQHLSLMLFYVIDKTLAISLSSCQFLPVHYAPEKQVSFPLLGGGQA